MRVLQRQRDEIYVRSDAPADGETGREITKSLFSTLPRQVAAAHTLCQGTEFMVRVALFSIFTAGSGESRHMAAL